MKIAMKYPGDENEIAHLWFIIGMKYPRNGNENAQ
jgi:hypothetical protein